MSQFLLVMTCDDSAFDPEELTSILREIPNVSELKKGADEMLLQWDFSFEEDQTTCRLGHDLDCITLDGLGDASLEMAIELRRRMGVNFRVVDSNYNFDIELDEASTTDTLRHVVGRLDKDGIDKTH